MTIIFNNFDLYSDKTLRNTPRFCQNFNSLNTNDYHMEYAMSVPLLLTILAGAATFVGAFLGVIGQRPSNRMLAFAPGSPRALCC